MLDYTGPVRDRRGASASADLVLTTYGTLRRDAAELTAIEFDYAILDEAQAIKNAATASAKAARLLRARHRLALSGTPIENHLGELWSLFEFLNPGPARNGEVVSARRARRAARGDEDLDVARRARCGRSSCAARRSRSRRSCRARTEQTLQCELEGGAAAALRRAARALPRDAARARSRATASTGRRCRSSRRCCGCGRRRATAASSIRARAHEPSAKFDVLIPRLSEVIEEGHKALVFSQFTSFLALLRPRLDALGDHLRVPRRPHARPRGARRAVPDRIRTAGCSSSA